MDAPLDYNILQGHIFMYAMKVVTSSMFLTMMLPHEKKVITIDQLTYHEPNSKGNLDNVLSTIEGNTCLDRNGIRGFQRLLLAEAYHGCLPLPYMDHITHIMKKKWWCVCVYECLQ